MRKKISDETLKRIVHKLKIVVLFLIACVLCNYLFKGFVQTTIAAINTIFVPLLIALILMYLLEPLVDALIKKLKFKRIPACLTVMVTLALIIIVGLFFFTTVVSEQVSKIVNDTNVYLARVDRSFDNIFYSVEEDDVLLGEYKYVDKTIGTQKVVDLFKAGKYEILFADAEFSNNYDAFVDETRLIKLVQETFNVSSQREVLEFSNKLFAKDKEIKISLTGIYNVVSEMFEINTNVSNAVLPIFSGIVKFTITLILTPIFLFFLLNDKKRIFKGILYVMPSNIQTPLATIGEKSNEMTKSYFRGKIISMIFVWIMFTILFFALGFGTTAILFGLLIAVLDLVPYLGPAVGVILPMLYALVSMGERGVFVAIMVLIVNFIIQGVQNNIIIPWLVGKEMKINTLLILVSMSFFGTLLGVWGVLLSIPLCGIIKVIFEYYKETHDIEEFVKLEN